MLFISQPTFFPWLGYFDLIDQSEVVVFLDDVDFAKQSWQQRNNFKTIEGLKKFTVPIDIKNSKSKQIKDILIFNSNHVSKKFKQFLKTNYHKSKYFSEYIEDLNTSVLEKMKNYKLITLNFEIIMWCLKVLGIKKKNNIFK